MVRQSMVRTVLVAVGITCAILGSVSAAYMTISDRQQAQDIRIVKNEQGLVGVKEQLAAMEARINAQFVEVKALIKAAP